MNRELFMHDKSFRVYKEKNRMAADPGHEGVRTRSKRRWPLTSFAEARHPAINSSATSAATPSPFLPVQPISQQPSLISDSSAPARNLVRFHY